MAIAESSNYKKILLCERYVLAAEKSADSNITQTPFYNETEGAVKGTEPVVITTVTDGGIDYGIFFDAKIGTLAKTGVSSSTPIQLLLNRAFRFENVRLTSDKNVSLLVQIYANYNKTVFGEGFDNTKIETLKLYSCGPEELADPHLHKMLHIL